MPAAPEPSGKESISFENGQSAQLLHVRQATEAAEILKTLSISESQAAIIVAGSTRPFRFLRKNRLTDLLSRGVAQAALESNAILLDDGLKAGVSELVGQGVADRGQKTTLVGVLPQRKTTNADLPPTVDQKDIEPNHTHFVLNEQNRPDGQARTMCDLAAAASTNKDWILTILVGGESKGSALDLALETVRRGWPLVVIKGSGSLADKIVRLKKEALDLERQTSTIWRWINPFWVFRRLRPLQNTNPRLYEIISDGKLMIVGSTFDAIQLRNLIKGVFTRPPEENILWIAWRRFAEYDVNSSRHRNLWHSLKDIPIILGVVSTLLVLVYSAGDIGNTLLIGEQGQNTLWAGWYTTFMSWLSAIRGYSLLDLIFRFAIILLPISSSIILGIETRLKLGSKYILLRGGAETVKRGIYSFRVLQGRTGNDPKQLLPYDEQGLAAHLGRISKILLDSDVKEAAFTPYDRRIPPNMFGAESYDDGFSPLDPETYVKVRIGDQLKFYTLRTNQYEKRIRQLQYRALIFGGIGTFLAAIGAQYWLPLTAAIVSATSAFLEYPQLEQILTKYNLTKASLETIQAKWLALSPSGRADDKQIQNLVREVEAILESENQGWVQYIKQAQEPGEGGKATEE
jgi:SLOG in TRPM, prokaryote/SMODS and SLOG-associating 2TM effector domain 1